MVCSDLCVGVAAAVGADERRCDSRSSFWREASCLRFVASLSSSDEAAVSWRREEEEGVILDSDGGFEDCVECKLEPP